MRRSKFIGIALLFLGLGAIFGGLLVTTQHSPDIDIDPADAILQSEEGSSTTIEEHLSNTSNKRYAKEVTRTSINPRDERSELDYFGKMEALKQQSWENTPRNATPLTDEQWSSLVSIEERAKKMTVPQDFLRSSYSAFMLFRNQDVVDRCPRSAAINQMWNEGKIDELTQWAMERLARDDFDMAGNIVIFSVAVQYEKDVGRAILAMSRLLENIEKNPISMSDIAPTLVDNILNKSQVLRKIPTTAWKEMKSQPSPEPPLGEFPGYVYLNMLELKHGL